MDKLEIFKEGKIIIRRRMITDLHLSDINLYVFAIIYELSEDGVSVCNLSLKEFQIITDVSKSKIFAALKELTERGLIIKNDLHSTTDGVNEYKVKPFLLKFISEK